MYNSHKKSWYILQTFSGLENRTVKKIKEKIKSSKISNLFGKIMVPGEKVIEIQSGEEKKSELKFFPGYILINMHINETSWLLINSVPKIIGFIGGSINQPTPIHEKEIQKINHKLSLLGDQPRPKITFTIGEKIRVKNGPFANFPGIVEDIDYGKNRIKVSVSIFGRSTPVELNFNQIEKNT
ncbi:transcription termination/antitermination protein NusG [Buchnera aphidicola]|uniref:Transcription termination/antitermination protein NusG n=1 Tax=Buchnera aphidicola (Sarucallis kahawaluokalani) TaxID=1241878 RepID=A0A4D6YCD1_9GAMM|nr:transcription termination/antitermination protein NusG [Buchnera aphidicola]QCI25843.1 transcription termination/antitermination protein NusG [Buchnera aphidicola (Sarucallis kahawaluokalani)]